MDAKELLLEELGLLYVEEYRALTTSAVIVAGQSSPCRARCLLQQYFDETEEHLLRLQDLFDYLDCPQQQVTIPTENALDMSFSTSNKLFLVGKTPRSSDSTEAFLRLDRLALDRYRTSLSRARAFGATKVVAVLFQSFQEKVAMQQRFSSDLRVIDDLNRLPESGAGEELIFLEAEGVRCV